MVESVAVRAFRPSRQGKNLKVAVGGPGVGVENEIASET